MILKNDFFNILGFAVRAGKVSFGAFACDRGVKSGKIRLMLLDAGASERTAKDMRNMCAYYEVPLITVEPQGLLAERAGRGGLIVMGVTDAGFTKRLLEIANSEKVEV